jgi:hypothetical protein
LSLVPHSQRSRLPRRLGLENRMLLLHPDSQITACTFSSLRPTMTVSRATPKVV